jgi:uncharacterized protein (TIGR02266 family)
MNAISKISEKRFYPRTSFITKVVFEDELGEGLFYVFSKDISMGGLFLASDIPVAVGALLFLSFALPGCAKPVKVTGEVVRQCDREGGGMGIRFLGLSGFARKRLEDFLETD